MHLSTIKVSVILAFTGLAFQFIFDFKLFYSFAKMASRQFGIEVENPSKYVRISLTDVLDSSIKTIYFPGCTGYMRGRYSGTPFQLTGGAVQIMKWKQNADACH